ncbi:MAG: Glyoxalase/bleomycin resistance protein/dioxygenase [Acidimicrobiia bacterium]|nr:Glyoxalase/bleomycin resistance protein/dioxygenase [Acidimicrobiia bacterium]
MPVTRLNHAVLYVRDVERTREFYENVLGFSTLFFVPGQAAFFRAGASTNDHDLGTFQIGSGAGPSMAGRATVGLYHLAWEVDTLAELVRIRQLLVERGSLVGQSDHTTTKALYAKDPDGIEFEVSWLVPADSITDEMRSVMASGGGRPEPLDLDAEIARYGADRPGGIGVSSPARA